MDGSVARTKLIARLQRTPGVPVSRRELQAITGLGRIPLNRMVRQLREELMPVCSSPKSGASGYWWGDRAAVEKMAEESYDLAQAHMSTYRLNRAILQKLSAPPEDERGQIGLALA